MVGTFLSRTRFDNMMLRNNEFFWLSVGQPKYLFSFCLYVIYQCLKIECVLKP